MTTFAPIIQAVLSKHECFVEKGIRHEDAGSTEVNPDTGKTIHGGQFAPSGGGIKIQRTVNVANAWHDAVNHTYLSSSWGMLAVRELMQNSVDAVRKAVKLGETPRGNGRVTIEISPRYHTIKCTDNGVGLDQNDIETKLMQLNSSGKRGDAEAAGGMGMAKAIIFGCTTKDNWSFHTRDNSVSCNDEDGVVLHKTPDYKKGMEIQLNGVRAYKYADYWDNAEVSSMMNAIRMSDIKDVDVSIENKDSGTTFHSGDFFGRKRMTKLDYFSNEWIPGTHADVYTISETGSKHEQNNRVIIRLNGLLQFVKPFNGNGCGKSIVVDISTTAKPGGNYPEYPFSSGRDSIKYDMDRTMNKVIAYVAKPEKADEDRPAWEDTVYNIDDQDDEPEEAEVNFAPAPDRKPANTGSQTKGEVGTRTTGADRGKQQESEAPEESGYDPHDPPPPTTYAEKVARFVSQPSKDTIREDESGQQILEMMNGISGRLGKIMNGYTWKLPKSAFLVRREIKTYKGKFDVAKNIQLMTCWDTITHLLGSAYSKKTGRPICAENYGTGFYLGKDDKGENTIAMHTRRGGGTPYLLLNPHHEPLKEGMRLAKDGEGADLVGKIWTYACHEMSHLNGFSEHDQAFSYNRENIAEVTSYLYPTMMQIVDACFNKKTIESTPEMKALANIQKQMKAESAPKVTFKNLVDAGHIPAGTKLWSARDSRHRAVVNADGTITSTPDPNYDKRYDGPDTFVPHTGSIHDVASKMNNWKSANGWHHWRVAPAPSLGLYGLETLDVYRQRHGHKKESI